MNYSHVAVLAVCTILTDNVGAQEYRYAVFKLPSLNESLNGDPVGGLNSFGDVVGKSATTSSLDGNAVIWPAEGGIIDLGTLGGDRSGAGDINDLGEVVGSSAFIPGDTAAHAFLWRGGVMLDLGTLGGETSGASAINNLAQVVGNSDWNLESGRVGFLWQDGQMTVLDDPWPDRNATDVWDINDGGVIVGKGLGVDGYQTALKWDNEDPVDLGSLTGKDSAAYAINNLGQIIGRSEAANGTKHAVLWIDGQIIDIHDDRYGAWSWWGDLNDTGQVIGSIGDELHTRELFIRKVGEPMRLLRDLVPPSLAFQWRFDTGSINDSGQIAVTAFPDGSLVDNHALLLSPVRPTITLSQPTPGLAGEVNSLSITGVTPGQRVHLLYSRNGGGTRIPGCDLQENALMLDSPKLAGSVVADANGEGVFTFFVPDAARNLGDILIQAVVPGECAVSNLVVEGFE